MEQFRQWWNEGQFERVRFLRYTPYPNNQACLSTDGIEDPSSDLVVLWRGPNCEHEVPVMLFYKDVYYAGTYDMMSMHDVWEETGQNVYVIDIAGAIEL